jgi:DNA polymerase IIIc chi subunit
LSSRFWRFQFISFINHTVNSQTDDNDEVIYVLKSNDKLLTKKVNELIQTQKNNPRYDYASHEQIEIDKLVYEAYGLNAEDVQEVENWYARRYPKLSAAQKANLRALGKSDDYLELYGMK